MQTCGHTCRHTYSDIQTGVHAAYIHAYIRTCRHTCIHACMHACMHACIHTECRLRVAVVPASGKKEVSAAGADSFRIGEAWGKMEITVPVTLDDS